MKSKKKKPFVYCIKEEPIFWGFFWGLKIHSSGLKSFIIHLKYTYNFI